MSGHARMDYRAVAEYVVKNDDTATAANALRTAADENQRLREALEQIAKLDKPISGDSTPAGTQCDWLKSLAREALAGDTE